MTPAADHAQAPYLDALREYARRRPGRFHVPGHKGGPGADPGLREALGEPALELDIPALMHGIDSGPEPTPFALAQELAADAWGAARSWFLINGASQGNHVALLALAHAGRDLVVQRNAHSSSIDACVLAGMRPTFVAPEVDPELGVAHCLTPAALDRALEATPAAVGASIVSPTYFGAVADVAGLAEVTHARGLPLIVDEAWGSHMTFHPSLPEPALALGADVVISSTHKIVGSLTQSAILHLGHGAAQRIDPDVVDRALTLIESTSPSALLTGSLDAARRLAATRGRELLTETLEVLDELRVGIRAIDGLDVLDERLVGSAGVFSYDPLRVAIDVRATGASGYAIGDLLRQRCDIGVELAGENVVVALFGLAEPARPQADRLLDGLREVVPELVRKGGADRRREAFAPPPPWGELALSPRDAFLGPQEVVAAEDAVGRIAAESLAAYPPGIPNVLPGERLSADTLAYIRQAIAAGGALRGASDRELRTLRVVVER